MDKTEFTKLALEIYGDKVAAMNSSDITDEDLANINKHNNTFLERDDLKVIDGEIGCSNKCPVCDVGLLGLFFGTFTWGLMHGHGNCSECGTAFKYYHYVKDKGGGTAQLCFMAVRSIPQKLMTEPSNGN